MARTSSGVLDQTSNDDESITSERHGLLASERRRLALDVLSGRTTAVELDELTAQIAAREAGIDAENQDEVERVAMTLHHVHLPKMTNAGVLDYDPETNLIDPSEPTGIE